ncbi:hypothetical protein H1S01_19630 [Heliobacterium chlorum]|uniref:Uncharacterized protein n=1 Tax=Heliobacterium chlorum TaxID=2698 RepID=A0ABR7T988_HELCL|nr:hypothetical protein [Heliobacterium chlorum]MBC9786655.1 hypothetical protein [Heliobacterium chlorum]
MVLINQIKNVKDSVIITGSDNDIKLMKTAVSYNTDKEIDLIELINIISALQKRMPNLPDDYEVIRDQKLIPILSEVKYEAKNMLDTSDKNTNIILSKIKDFYEVAKTIKDFSTLVSPLMDLLTNLTGINF